MTNAKGSATGWTKLQKHKKAPWSVYLGALGMPGASMRLCKSSNFLGTEMTSSRIGQTAYFGWKKFIEEKAKTVCRTILLG